MLRGSPVGDDVDRGSINEIIAVFSRFLLKRVHEDLKISVRDLPDEFSGRIVVQIDHQSAHFFKQSLAPRRTSRLSVTVLMSALSTGFFRRRSSSPPVCP